MPNSLQVRRAFGAGVFNKRTPPQTIILIGDSITAQNGLGHTSIDRSDGQGASGYWIWANYYLNQNFITVTNKGVGGETTTQMLARFNTDVLALSSGWVCICGGENDIAGGVAASTVISNLSEMVNRSKAAGRNVLLLTVLPSTFYDTAGKRTELTTANAWILSQDSSRVVVADVWSVTQDVGNNGFPITGYTTDGVHPSSHGAERIGRCIAAVMMPHTQTQNLAGALGVVGKSPAITHDNFAATTGWNLVGTTVAVANNILTVTLGSYPGYNDPGTNKITNISEGLWQAGDILQAFVYMAWSNVVPHVAATMAHYPYLTLQLRNVDNSFLAYSAMEMFVGSASWKSVDSVLLPASGEGILLTNRIQVGANVNRLYTKLGWYGADSGTFQFSDLHVWKE